MVAYSYHRRKMRFSHDLEEAIKRAYADMMAHPSHALIPVSRQAIYDLLDLSDPTQSRRSFRWLSIITARYVLPIWQTARFTDSTPKRALDMAEEIMNKKGLAPVVNVEADEVWHKMESLGATQEGKTIGDAFYAGQAAVEALMEVSGKDPFKDIIIDRSFTDSDLDPWSSDTAHWAVAAYAGSSGKVNSGAVRRQEFWEWWLEHAIAEAFKLSTT